MEPKANETQVVFNESHKFFESGRNNIFILASCYQPGSKDGEMFMCEGKLIASIDEKCQIVKKALTKEESDDLIVSVARAEYYGDMLVSNTWSYLDEAKNTYVAVGYGDLVLALIVNSSWFKASDTNIQQQILDAHGSGLTHLLQEFYDVAIRNEHKANQITKVVNLTIPEPWNFSRARIDYILKKVDGHSQQIKYTANRMCLHLPFPHKSKALQELTYDDFTDHVKTLRRLGVVKWNPKEFKEWEKVQLG